MTTFFCFKSVFIIEMKKILFYLILLFFTTGLNAQTENSGKRIYNDLGVIRLQKPNGIISVGGYITIEKEYNYDHVQNNIREVKQEVYNKKKYDKVLEPEIVYHYEIYFVSNSVFNGDSTSTWVNGLKIFTDGKQLLAEQFPEGFIISIKTEPTLIHVYHSKSDSVAFNIEWDKLLYEPRIRK